MKCSCKHGHDRHGRETITFCAAHQAEHDATRKRWHEDYARQHAEVTANDGSGDANG